MYYTTKLPETQNLIRQEFLDCDNEITSGHLSNAVYTKACLQETYRICPTAFCLARILEEDVTLSGYNLSKGVSIIYLFIVANFKIK